MCKWQIEDGFTDCPACPYDGDCDEQEQDADWDDSIFDEQEAELNNSFELISKFE